MSKKDERKKAVNFITLATLVPHLHVIDYPRVSESEAGCYSSGYVTIEGFDDWCLLFRHAVSQQAIPSSSPAN